MGGSGPMGPFLQLPTNMLANPEQLRRLQAEEQKRQIQQLQVEVEKLKKERQQQPKVDAAKDLTDSLVKIASESFDKGSAYTNLIIFAGYGAFFALWSMIHSDLSPLPAALAILLMLISASVFVFFEIYRMASTATMMRPLYQLIENPDGQLPLAVMQQKVRDFQEQSRRITISFNRVWEVVLVVCVPTGGLAVLILATALIHRIFGTLITALQ